MQAKRKHRAYHPRCALVDGIMASKHPLYHVHANMIDRCLNPNSKAFKNYGARGIKVDESWLSFANFVADMGPRPTPFHTLERKDNDRGYSPDNCTWATRTTQCLNRRVFESNTTGATGVARSGNQYVARFDFEGTRYDIGRFDDLDRAILARVAFANGFMAARGGLHG